MESPGPRFSEVFQKISSHEEPSPALIRAAFDAILCGAWTASQIAGLMVALRMRGESAGVITAVAESFRASMVKVEHGFDRLLDTCGTGGDAKGTLNLSTGAAILAAAAGVPVAKHGNRAVSSQAGSADVVEALGIPVDLTAAGAGAVLKQVGIGFLFAPTHHPAMRHAAVARKELGIRSIFNCLGPLVNPARPNYQLVGAYDDGLRNVMAEVLRSLGTARAWIVRGTDGLDEVSPCAPTRVTELSGSSIAEMVVAPNDFGVAALAESDIVGGSPAENARALELVLSGEPHPATDAFVLNGAAALVVALELEPRRAAERVREALASGAAKKTLESWRSEAVRARQSG
jgi:anthranilate phosphoribosyltransferase